MTSEEYLTQPPRDSNNPHETTITAERKTKMVQQNNASASRNGKSKEARR
jgi:hypothetical protein